MSRNTSLIAALLAVAVHVIQAFSTVNNDRFCLIFDIPVTVSAENALYGTSEISNNIDAVEYAVYTDTWSTPPAPDRVVQNITVTGTYTISAQLCTPKASAMAQKSHVLQIATHGLLFDKRYWDVEISPSEYSYVESAVSAGYSILTYDRLGTGLSDKPDAYRVVQAPLELQILRELTKMARSGVLYNHARKQDGSPPELQELGRPDKIVHVGHSFGSLLTSALITGYGNLSDGAIITGFIPNKEAAQTRATSFGLELARLVDPVKFKLPDGYLAQRTESSVQTIFFHKGNFNPRLLGYANDIKQAITVGEYDSTSALNLGYGPTFQGPLQYIEAEFDFLICDGDCKGTYNVTLLKEIYPRAKVIEAYMQPDAGHALTMHRNASAWYEVSHDFLRTNGL